MSTVNVKAKVLSIAIATVVLSACGESDLPEHHEEELAAARQERQEAEIAAANPGSNEDSLTTDTGDQSESSTDGDAEETDAGSQDTDETTSSVDGGSTGADAESETSDENLAESGEESSGEAGEEPGEVGDESSEEGQQNSGEGEETSSVASLDLANDYTLVFADEFNGTSLDTSMWKTALEWGPELIINEEQQYYVDTETDPNFGYNPFSFDGSNLTITAIPTPAALEESAAGQPYLSGVLSTATRFDMQFGYVEARMDLPVGASLWPSFWMLSSDYNATTLRPRVFIAEYNGGEPSSIFHNYQYEDDEGAVRSPGQFRVSDATLGEGFHTIGMAWTPEDLVFYLDGEPRYRVVGDKIPQQAMYLILNLAVGGVWVDPPSENTPNPAELVIDYVRVFERNGG